MRPSTIMLAVIIVGVIITITAGFGLAIFGGGDPSVTVVGLSPSNQSAISYGNPTIEMNLTLQAVKAESLTFELSINGQNSTSVPTLTQNGVQFSLPDELDDGVCEVSVNISVGNRTLASQSWVFTIDTTPPALTQLDPANGTRHPGDGLVVSANFTDLTGVGLDRLRLLLDGSDITNSSVKHDESLSFTPPTTLGEGVHDFTIELCDAVGNAASFSWFIIIEYPVEDTFPPYIIAHYPANNSLISDSKPTLWFHVNDTLSIIDIDSLTLKINNILVAFNCTGDHLSGWTISHSAPLTDNNHTAWIYLRDINNNSRAELVAFTVDSTPPEISGFTPSNGSILNTSHVTISAQFLDLISGVNPSTAVLTVDSLYNPINAIVNSSGFSYSSLFMNGLHTVSIRVSDNAGNVARATWTFSINVPSNNTVPPNNTEPPQDVIILTKTGYFNTESGLPTIVGEVMNNGNTTVENIYVAGLFMCKDGNVINNDKKDPAIIYGYVEIAVLEPGGVSPFKLEMPSSFPDFRYILKELSKYDAKVISYSVTTDVPYTHFTFSNTTGLLMADKHYNLTGVITNTGSSTIADTKVVATFYTPDKTIAVESVHVYSLGPGESAYFTVYVEDNKVAPLITRYDLKASA